MAFKRVAKFMKRKYGMKQTKSRRGGDVEMKAAVQLSEQYKTNARKGARTIYMSSAFDQKVYYQAKEESFVDEVKMKKKPVIESTTPIIAVARYLNATFSKATGKNVTVAAKLKRILKVKYASEYEKLTDAPIMKSGAAELENIVNRNNLLKEGKSTGEKDDPNGVLEYLSGTVIYYGAKVALQARHGGYLSYHNATEIKASAHKVLSQTKFIIINSSDLTDFGAVKYGDAIWLQAGQHEVLGANYVVNAAAGADKGERKIRPALINCRRNNIFKAQQYGRWIILNRDFPTETIGQLVLHHDKIVLEQEWYFLASSSPYDAGMHRHGSNQSYGVAPSTQINLFKPGEDCTWKMHLLGLPGDEKGDEKQRQMLLHHAQDQLETSTDLRFKKKDEITGSLRDSLPARLTDENFVKFNLRHKSSEQAIQKSFIKKYSKMSEAGFTGYESNSKTLAAIYGKESKICELKTDVNRMRLDRHGILRPKEKVRIPDRRSVMQIEKDKYWLMAQSLLINTKAWANLSNAMLPYYKIDRKKKIAAAIIMQRWIRACQKKVFSYARMMRALDHVVTENLEKIRAKALAAKMLALAPAPGSLEAARALAASQLSSNSETGVHVLTVGPSNGITGEVGTSKTSARIYSGGRRRTEIVDDFKRKQKNRLSVLIRPITANAIAFDRPMSASAAAVMPPLDATVLPVDVTPPSSPRDAAPRTESYRTIPKPVSISSPAPFSETFVTTRAKVMSPSDLLKSSRFDEEEEDEDDEEGDSLFEDVYEDNDENEESYRIQPTAHLIRGESAPSLRHRGGDGEGDGRGVGDTTRHGNERSLSRAKSAKLSRDEDVRHSHDPRHRQFADNLHLNRPNTSEGTQFRPESSSETYSFFKVENKYRRPVHNLDASLLVGLPQDVFEDPCKQLSVSSGIKYLRAVSAKSKVKQYTDIVVKKKRDDRKL